MAETLEMSIPSSTDPTVDGTAFTTNPLIKFRRKRTMSEPKHFTKRVKIKEFLALCKWLTGAIDKPLEKPTVQHLQILSNIRNNTDVLDNYKACIDDNYELVTNAALIMPKEVAARWKELIQSNKKTTEQLDEPEHTKSIKDSAVKIDISSVQAACSTTVTATKYKDAVDYSNKEALRDSLQGKQNKNMFDKSVDYYNKVVDWLVSNDNILMSSDFQVFANCLATYRVNKNFSKSVCAMSIKHVVAARFEELSDFATYKDRLVRRSTLMEERRNLWKDARMFCKHAYVTTDKALHRFDIGCLQEATEQTACLEHVANGQIVDKPVTVETKESAQMSNEDSQKSYSAPDTLSMLISLAKKAGASKLVIEL